MARRDDMVVAVAPAVWMSWVNELNCAPVVTGSDVGCWHPMPRCDGRRDAIDGSQVAFGEILARLTGGGWFVARNSYSHLQVSPSADTGRELRQGMRPRDTRVT